MQNSAVQEMEDLEELVDAAATKKKNEKNEKKRSFEKGKGKKMKTSTKKGKAKVQVPREESSDNSDAEEQATKSDAVEENNAAQSMTPPEQEEARLPVKIFRMVMDHDDVPDVLAGDEESGVTYKLMLKLFKATVKNMDMEELKKSGVIPAIVEEMCGEDGLQAMADYDDDAQVELLHKILAMCC